jgi:hypothetical protein
MDWSGFNVPSSILKDVYVYKLESITDHNKYDVFMGNLYDHIVCMERAKNPGYQWDADFYLIGTSDAGYRGDGDPDAVLHHEYAHAFWNNDDTYKRAMSKELDKIVAWRYDTFVETIQEMGYHQSTCRDEVHAFCATGPSPELLDVVSGIDTMHMKRLFDQKLRNAAQGD